MKFPQILQGDIVTIYDKNGKIGLNFCLNGKRKRFSLGLTYNAKNLKIAKIKAAELESDIVYSRFDGNISKYKIKNVTTIDIVNSQPQPTDSYLKSCFNIKNCWELYKNHKKNLIVESEQKTHWIKVDQKIALLDAENLLNIDDALAALEFLLNQYAYGTLKNIFKTLSTAVNLAIKLNKYAGKNDYATVLELFPKTSQKTTIQAYTKEEVIFIVDAFKNNHYWAKNNNIVPPEYYSFLVQFRFLVGCRPSEAIALTWNDIIVENGKSWIIFCKAYRDGCLQLRTKTNEIRAFPVYSQLEQFLISLPQIPNENNLIFPSPTNGYINNSKFDNNYWYPLIHDGLFKDGKISKYLPFYDQRHTCGTLLLQSGIDIATIAKILGNSPKVLMNHYLAARNELSNIQNIF